MNHIYKHGGQLSVELSHNDCVQPGSHVSPEVCAALMYFLLVSLVTMVCVLNSCFQKFNLEDFCPF